MNLEKNHLSGTLAKCGLCQPPPLLGECAHPAHIAHPNSGELGYPAHKTGGGSFSRNLTRIPFKLLGYDKGGIPTPEL